MCVLLLSVVEYHKWVYAKSCGGVGWDDDNAMRVVDGREHGRDFVWI